MRKFVHLLPLLLSAWLAAMPAVAQEPGSPADDAGGAGVAIRGVIQAQLEAFRRDDGEAAFAHASPGIRAMFGDAATFLEMVRAGYAPVHRPREVEFRGLGLEDGRPTQRVLLVGPDGVPVIARYTMERQPDGSWRIAGCVLERAPDVAT